VNELVDKLVAMAREDKRIGCIAGCLGMLLMSMVLFTGLCIILCIIGGMVELFNSLTTP